MIIWEFIQNQLLRMDWLSNLITSILSFFGVDVTSQLGGSLHFFIYDVIKIFILLSILIYSISYIQSYFPPERTKKILGRHKGITANILSALLGTVTPFCSCSSIPIFMGFTSAGLPVGVTFSFLISSPLVDMGSLVLLMSIFGAEVAIVYVIVGLVLAVVGGYVLEKMGMEKYVEQFIKDAPSIHAQEEELTSKQRRDYSKEQMLETLKKVYLYVLIGVGIGALIHNVIPAEFIQKILGTNNPLSVILATLVGIPMYADIFGTIPIAEALFAKGVGLGTVLSFMMAVTALSFPSIVMLKRAVKPKLLVAFVSIVGFGIILIGYLFNTFQYLF